MPGLLRISEAFALAFHAMMHMVSTRPEKPVSARKLAQIFQVSEAHLAKVLQRMARMGLLQSKRGPKGGFSLSSTTDKATLLDIHTAVDGPLDRTTCLLGEHICKPGTCVMEKLLLSVYDNVHDRLADTKLSDLVRAAADQPIPSRKK